MQMQVRGLYNINMNIKVRDGKFKAKLSTPVSGESASLKFKAKKDPILEKEQEWRGKRKIYSES